jgi:hypothetical protein
MALPALDWRRKKEKNLRPEISADLVKRRYPVMFPRW